MQNFFQHFCTNILWHFDLQNYSIFISCETYLEIYSKAEAAVMLHKNKKIAILGLNLTQTLTLAQTITLILTQTLTQTLTII